MKEECSLKKKQTYLLEKYNPQAILKKFKTIKNVCFDYAERNPIKSIIIIYFLFLAIKIMVTQLYIFPSVSFDSYQYLKMSNSFFNAENFLIDGLPSHKYPPLYPILISPSHIFTDAILVNRTILLINSVVSTLIIFPAYFLSKEFLKTKESIIVSIIILMLPMNFVFSFLIFSENLFFPAFLCSIYFLYKSLTTEQTKYIVATGFFIGLCILTKYSAFAAIPAIFLIVLICYFFKYYNSEKPDLKWLFLSIKHWALLSLISVIMIIPWLYRNYSLFDSSVSGVIGYESFFQMADESILQITSIAGQSSTTTEILTQSGVQYNIFIDLLIQVIIHHGFIILASGIIFFIIGLKLFYKSFTSKNINTFIFGAITFITVEFFIVMTAVHNLSCTIIWRLNGRYIEAALPLVIIFGIIAYTKCNLPKNFTKTLLLISWPIFFMAPTIWESYDNRMSISYLILVKEKYVSMIPSIGDFFSNNIALFKILMFIFLLVIFVIIFKKYTKKALVMFSFLLILSACICPTVIIMNTRNRSTITNEYALGTWINENTKGADDLLIFDKQMDEDMRTGLVGMKIRQRLASWTTSQIRLEEITEKSLIENSFSYIISFRQITSENLTEIYNKTLLLPIGWINPKTAEGEKIVYIYAPKI